MSLCKFSNLKKSFFTLTVVIFLVTIKLLYKMDEPAISLKLRSVKRWSEASLTATQPPHNTFLKVVHLDLKGAPPKIRFLLTILPLLRRSGANALLIEYEDMFPFSGRLRNISAGNPYLLSEVRRLLKFAEGLNMEVIPLIQTFGHLEYVLKLEEFQHLREAEDFPQEICPSSLEAVDLVKEMISQVMAVHPKSRYIHIGCDEIRHIGECPRCSRTDHRTLFSRHVTRIADFVRTKYPGVTPLIWDDMLRNWPHKDLASSGLGSSVEPVVWVYGDNILTLVPPFTWNLYRSTFPRIWLASAFKGAFGETEVLPNLTRHLHNHLAWTSIFAPDDSTALTPTNFSGIFLTGWSRYDHFAVLCELLPVGVPSLVLGLVFLQPWGPQGFSNGFAKWLRLLGCPSTFPRPGRRNETFYQDALGNCSFPGSNLYAGVVELRRLRARAAEMTRRVEGSAWASRYNVRNNFSSPWRLLQMFPEEGFSGELLRKDVYLWKSGFLSAMEEYFDRDTVVEWQEQNVKPLEEKLKEIRHSFGRLMGRKTWPRRPLR